MVEPVALDENDCGSPEDVYTLLEDRLGQTVTFEGLAEDGNLVQIYVGEIGGTWSLIFTDPSLPQDMQSCVIDGGDYWTFIDNNGLDPTTVEPQTAADAWDEGQLQFKDLPALMNHFSENAYWTGFDFDGEQYVVTLTDTTFHVYREDFPSNYHPYSEPLTLQISDGEPLDVKNTQGSGIPTSNL